MNERLEKFFEYCDGSGTQNLYGFSTYIKRPDKLRTLSEVQDYDKKAVSEIEYLKNKIQLLKDYRTELYNRYQEINSTNYHLQLTIERQRRYADNKVYYYVTLERVPERKDVANRILRQDVFKGKERHDALKHFEILKRNHPHAEIVKKLEKSKWEK